MGRHFRIFNCLIYICRCIYICPGDIYYSEHVHCVTIVKLSVGYHVTYSTHFLSVCMWENLITGLVHFFKFAKKKFSHFSIFLLFLHLCNRNSLAGLVQFFKINLIFNFFLIFLLVLKFIHFLLYVWEALAELVYFFFWITFFFTFLYFPIAFTFNSLARILHFFQKKIVFYFSYFFYSI